MCSLLTCIKGKQWVKDFVALGRFEGFQRKFVTPYVHCMVYHVPHQIRRFGNLLQFSGQGTLIVMFLIYDCSPVAHTQVLRRTMT